MPPEPAIRIRGASKSFGELRAVRELDLEVPTGSVCGFLGPNGAGMTPAMLLFMVPLLLWLPISESPNGALATATSFVPPLVPFVMVLRIAGDEPIAAWQIAASLVLGYAAMAAMVWMAARVFRVGVLLYGKPPTPIELLRWMRYV